MERHEPRSKEMQQQRVVVSAAPTEPQTEALLPSLPMMIAASRRVASLAWRWEFLASSGAA